MDDSPTPDQCTATAKSTGEQCKKAPVPGATVCNVHGGSAGQVQKKAQERLDKMADSVTADAQEMVADLRELYDTADQDEKVAIMAELRKNWKLVLDRTEHGPTETREHTGKGGGPLQVSIGGDDTS